MTTTETMLLTALPVVLYLLAKRKWKIAITISHK